MGLFFFVKKGFNKFQKQLDFSILWCKITLNVNKMKEAGELDGAFIKGREKENF